MVAVPREIGSFEDKKFREEIAKRIALARYTLFSKEQIDLSGAGIEVEMFRKTFSQPIFTTPGDTIYLDIHGHFTNNVNNKQITIKVLDDTGAVLASFGSQVFVGADTFFNLRCNITLTSAKKISLSTSIVSDLATRYSDADFAIAVANYVVKKCAIVIYGTGGGASDVTIYSLRAEFAPGKLE